MMKREGGGRGGQTRVKVKIEGCSKSKKKKILNSGKYGCGEPGGGPFS